MEFSVRQVPAMRLACIKFQGKISELREAWDRITAWAARTGVLGRGPLVAATTDELGAAGAHKFAVGVGVAKDVEVEDPIEVVVTRAGLYAVALEQGNESALPEMWRRLVHEWIAKSGCERRKGEPVLQFRLSSPKQVGEGDMIIELCVPVDRNTPLEVEEKPKDRLNALLKGDLEGEDPPLEEEEEEEVVDDEDAEAAGGDDAEAAPKPGAGDEAAPKRRGRPPGAVSKVPVAKKKAAPLADEELGDEDVDDEEVDDDEADDEESAPVKGKASKPDKAAKVGKPTKPVKAEPPAKASKAEKSAKPSTPAKSAKEAPAKASKAKPAKAPEKSAAKAKAPAAKAPVAKAPVAKTPAVKGKAGEKPKKK